MCFCVLLYFTACMLYYCNTVGWAWWDWCLIWWMTILLQCFDTVGWVTWPVKISSPNDLYCVEWDVKPYSTTTTVMFTHRTVMPTNAAVARCCCSAGCVCHRYACCCIRFCTLQSITRNLSRLLTVLLTSTISSTRYLWMHTLVSAVTFSDCSLVTT